MAIIDSNRIARNISQRLGFGPEQVVALAIKNDEVLAAVSSLAESAGATTVSVDSNLEVEVSGVALELDYPVDPRVPAEVRGAIERVTYGGNILLVISGLGADVHPNEVAKVVAPTVQMGPSEAELAGGVLLVWGKRRAKTPRDKLKRLRGQAHSVEPTVLIGRPGVTDEVLASARESVERHGLIKVKMTPQCKADKEQVAKDLAWGTGSVLVQRVGKVAILYRPDVKLNPPTSRRRGR